jgi:hypothetical protein
MDSISKEVIINQLQINKVTCEEKLRQIDINIDVVSYSQESHIYKITGRYWDNDSVRLKNTYESKTPETIENAIKLASYTFLENNLRRFEATIEVCLNGGFIKINNEGLLNIFPDNIEVSKARECYC